MARRSARCGVPGGSRAAAWAVGQVVRHVSARTDEASGIALGQQLLVGRDDDGARQAEPLANARLAGNLVPARNLPSTIEALTAA